MGLEISENHERSFIWEILNKTVHGKSLSQSLNLLRNGFTLQFELHTNISFPERVYQTLYFFRCPEVEGSICQIRVSDPVSKRSENVSEDVLWHRK